MEISMAKQIGGKDCAAEQLAKAQAQLAFSELEVAQGDPIRAGQHLDEGIRVARLAVRGAKECDKKIVVRTVSTPTPVPEVVDSDGDGVPDGEDRCPSDPGTLITKGCPDRDEDLVADLDDRCPDEPGIPTEGGCPRIDISTLDTDGDGVPDIQDRCPADPGSPENQGCPFVDTDGDGVTDDRDKCPTVPGIPQFDGCEPPDRDKDGILDTVDKCPDQAAPGTPDGCPQFKHIVINLEKKMIELKETIHFATGKARILPNSFPILDEVSKVMEGNEKIEVRIEGHTDSQGSAVYNLKLSKSRADAVMRYMVRKGGVSRGRLRALGLGESSPIAPNTTGEGRALNRRVEFHITKQ